MSALEEWAKQEGQVLEGFDYSVPASTRIEEGTCRHCGEPIARRLLQEVDDLTGKALAYAWWHPRESTRYCYEMGGTEAEPESE